MLRLAWHSRLRPSESLSRSISGLRVVSGAAYCQRDLTWNLAYSCHNSRETGRSKLPIDAHGSNAAAPEARAATIGWKHQQDVCLESFGNFELVTHDSTWRGHAECVCTGTMYIVHCCIARGTLNKQLSFYQQLHSDRSLSSASADLILWVWLSSLGVHDHHLSGNS